MKPKHLLSLALPAAIFAALSSSASAQIATWSGATNGDWNTGTNWVLGGAPNGVSSDAIFNTVNNGQTSLSLSAATSVRSVYLYGGNYTFGGATALNFGGGGGFNQLGSGTWTVNNNITGAGDIAFTGTGTGTITLNGTIGNGANRFDKFNESNVTLTNAYTTTNVATNAASGGAAAMRIRAGALILSGAGTITQGAAAHITIGAASNYSAGVFHNNANAALVLDNTGTNNTNRVTDGNQINTSVRSLIDFKGNASAASSETLGIFNASGPGTRIRVSNGGGQSSRLTFSSLQVGGAAGTGDTNANPTVLQFLVPNGSTLGVAGTTGSRVLFTTAPSLTNGVLRYGVVKDESVGGGVNFATYDNTASDNGAFLGVKALGSYSTTTLSGATNTQNVDATGNITLSATTAVNALRINATSGSAMTMGTNTLSFANAAGLIVTGGNDYAINNTSGTGITFSNAGYVYINSNTLNINAPVVKSTELTKAGDGALVINGAFSNGSSRHLGVDDGAATDDMTINGAISGGAQLVKNGWGTLVLGGSGNNSTFAGDSNGCFAINSGTVVLDKSSSGLQNTALGSGILTMNGGALAARNTAAVLANTVSFTQQGSASAASNFTGSKAITFTGLAQGALNSSQAYLVANNITTESLTFSGTMQGFSSNRVGGANSNFEFNGTGTTIVSGVIRNTDPAFADAALMTTGVNKTGTGLLILQNANTYTGLLPSSTASTAIQGGYLRADVTGALGTGNLLISEANFSFGMNAVLELGTGNTTFSRNLGIVGTNSVALGSTSGNALNNGGFASVTGTSIINLNGGTKAVTYGATGFFSSGGNLTLGSPNVSGTVDFQNAINLGNGTGSSNVTRIINTLDGAAAVDAILSGVIANSNSSSNNNGINKTGAGTLSLTAANTYSGNTTVSAGILSLGNSLALQNSALNTTGSILGTATAGLKTTVTTLTLGGLTGTKDLASLFITSGGYTGGLQGLTINPGSGVTNTYSGIIADGATGMTLKKTGLGSQTLSGANAYTGSTTLTSGTLNLDYSTQNNSKLSDTDALVLGGGTITLTGGSHAEIVGSTTLQTGGSTAISRPSGTATIRLGAITVNNGSTLNVASGVANTNNTNTNGILGGYATVGTTDWAQNSTNATDGSITAYTAYTTYNDVSTWSNSNGGSPSTANITNDNFWGFPSNNLGSALTINSLRYNFSGGGTVNANADLTLASGGLMITSNVTTASFLNGSAGLTSGGSNLYVIQNSGTDFSIGAAIFGSTNLVKTGTGRLILTNGFNSYTGETFINGGTVQISSNVNLGAQATGAALNLNGGTLQISANVGLFNGTAGTNNRSVNLGGNGGTFDTNGSTLTIAGPVGNLGAVNGSLSKTGLGTLVLAGSNTYTGSTSVSNGTLSLTGSLTGSSVTTSGSGILTQSSTGVISGTEVTFTQGSSGTSTLAGANTYTGTTAVTGGTLSLTGSLTGSNVVTSGSGNVSQTSTGVISGTGVTYTQASSGTSTLAGANTYTGPTLVSGGTLILSGSLTGSNVITSGGTLTQTSTGVIAGTGVTFSHSSGGTATLEGINTYTGGTNITGSNTILQLGNGNATGSLSTSSAIFNNANLTINRTGNIVQGTDFSGSAITGGGSLTKLASGNLTLSAQNTYSGGTSWGNSSSQSAGGIISLGNSSTGAAGSVTSGPLGTGTLTIRNNGAAASNYIQSTDSTARTINNNIAFSGTAIFLNTGGTGDLTFGGTVDTGTGAPTRTISVANTNTTFSGVISNTGKITKEGAGTLILSGANTYAGGTAVSAGTLLINGVGVLGTSSGAGQGGTVTVASGARLGGTGAIGGGTTLTNGTLAAGNAAATVGTLSFRAGLALNTGSIFEWDLQQVDATNPGTPPAAGGINQGSYDKVVLSGTANSLTGSADNVFKIVLGSGRTFSDAFWDTDKTWDNVFSGTGLGTSLVSIFSTINVNGTNLTGGLVAGEGTFTLNGSSTVNWTAVPEPSSALAGLLLATGLLRRRRA